MAQYLSSLSPVVLTLAVGLATVFGTFFAKLYRARMLLIDRRRKGLVCIKPAFHGGLSNSTYSPELPRRLARRTGPLVPVWSSALLEVAARSTAK